MRYLHEPEPEVVNRAMECLSCGHSYAADLDLACLQCSTPRWIEYAMDADPELRKLTVLDLKFAMTEFGLSIPENPVAVLHAANQLASKTGQKPGGGNADKRKQLL